MIQLHARDNFTSAMRKSLREAQSLNLSSTCGLVDDAAVLAIDGHDGLIENRFLPVPRAVQLSAVFILALGSGSGRPASAAPTGKARRRCRLRCCRGIPSSSSRRRSAPARGCVGQPPHRLHFDAVILAGRVEADLGLPHDRLLRLSIHCRCSWRLTHRLRIEASGTSLRSCPSKTVSAIS